MLGRAPGAVASFPVNPLALMENDMTTETSSGATIAQAGMTTEQLQGATNTQTEGVTAAVGSTAAEQPATGTDLMVVDFGADAGKGFENLKADEFAVPFMVMIQAGSPQVKPGNAKFIKGAQQGMFLKTSTGETFEAFEPSDGVPFIPVVRDHYYAEFTPEDKGSGFIGIKSADDPEVLSLREKQGKFGILKTARETELVEYYALYGLFPINPGYIFRGIIRFKSTEIKKYQGFMETANGIRYPDGKGGFMIDAPPLWAHKWILTTKPEKKKEYDWIGMRLTLANGATGRFPDPQKKGEADADYRARLASNPGPRPALIRPNDPLYIMAKEFSASIASGRVKADYEGAEQADGGGANEDIPF